MSAQRTGLDAIAEEAAGCRACELWAPATQVVFGEGPENAAIVLVGEQPGDQEDLAGRPFVGPAGRVLDRALAAAGIDRDIVYVTNAVKHFKFSQRGKRRIHQKPNTTEILACHRWIEAELTLLDPTVVVMLGVVAARSLLGRPVTIREVRGRPIAFDGRDGARANGRIGVITVHPSAVLRSQSDREATFAGLVDDLRTAKASLAG